MTDTPDPAIIAYAAALKDAAEMVREGFMIVAPEGVGQRQSLEGYRAQISSAILALRPKGLREALEGMVKPLSWFEVEKSRLGGKYTADGYTIRYVEGLWLLDFAGGSKSKWRFIDLEAAEAAAQADYTRRIVAAFLGDGE